LLAALEELGCFGGSEEFEIISHGVSEVAGLFNGDLRLTLAGEYQRSL
jgi:hypothetical protein